jgi:predicted ATPase/DNA-binding winged helix-turn-helix (wHTH) protein
VALRFGEFLLDTERFELRAGARIVHVEPQVFDVLSYLVAHRDRVVGKDELLAEVWGNSFVSDSTLTSRIKAARRAIGDDGQHQALIKTVRGRGFRFVAPVREDAHAPVDADGLVAAGVPAARPAPPRALPIAWGPLIGRAAEVSDIVRLVLDARLVTVVGPGGVGKTRCAIDAAARVGAELGLEVNFVDLVPVAEPAGVAAEIADALGLRTDGAQGPMAVLSAALRDDDRLLLLDNFEHVVAAAPTILRLLEAAPTMRALVTSRERLRLSGERVFTLGPLRWDSPAGPAPAVELFEVAARRTDATFRVDADNAADVEALCRAVDGLPLGIELAAAHVRLLPPGPLRLRLGGRLASLATDARDVPDRQRTVRDTVAWSLRLLDERERRLLTRLATFRAGADLDGVERVCLPDLDLDSMTSIGALTDKSLLRRRVGADGTPRFSMLELVRELAGKELDASPDGPVTRDRHAGYHHDFARSVEENRWTELAAGWVGILGERFADIEAAIGYDFGAGDADRAARTVAALSGYWHRSGRTAAGAGWTRLALARSASLTPLDRGRLHVGAGYLAFFRRQTAQARTHWERSLECFDEVGHDRYRALALLDIAGTWMGDADRSAQAIAMCERAVRLSRRVGEPPLIAHAVNVLGELLRLAGDDRRARAAYEEGLELTARIGDETHRTIFELNLGTLALRRGDAVNAIDLGRTALRRAAATRVQVLAANAVAGVAGAELARGRAERAALLLGAADAALELLGASRGPGDQPEYLRVVDELGVSLGGPRLAALTAEGRGMSLGEATAEALSER